MLTVKRHLLSAVLALAALGSVSHAFAFVPRASFPSSHR